MMIRRLFRLPVSPQLLVSQTTAPVVRARAVAAAAPCSRDFASSAAAYYCSGCGSLVTTGSCTSCGPQTRPARRQFRRPRDPEGASVAGLSQPQPGQRLGIRQASQPIPPSRQAWDCPFCHHNVEDGAPNCPQCQHARPVDIHIEKYRSAWSWLCPACGFAQHGWRRACRNCTALKPLRCAIFSPKNLQLISPAEQARQLPDYTCVACSKPTSAQNQRCLSCGQPRLFWPTGMRIQINDWVCSGCGSLTMANRDSCVVCFEPQSKFPIRVLKPDWWVCAGCGGANFPVMTCFHCQRRRDPLNDSVHQLRIPAEQRRKLILQRELAYQKELREEIEEARRKSARSEHRR